MTQLATASAGSVASRFFEYDDFWPTPRFLVNKMVGIVAPYVTPSSVLLEPSAGHGAIANVLREQFPANTLHVVEIAPKLRAHLSDVGFNVVGDNIFTYNGHADVIVANFPFRNNFQDIDHFCRCYRLLNPGGVMVAIVHEYSAFPFHRTGKPVRFTQWLDRIGARREKLPKGAFLQAERRTSTGTAMIVARKPV